jgi:hypothetical protein
MSHLGRLRLAIATAFVAIATTLGSSGGGDFPLLR